MNEQTEIILTNTIQELRGYAAQTGPASTRNGVLNATTDRLESLELNPESLQSAIDAAIDLLTVLQAAKRTAQDMT
jgi:hypothetical protein